MPIDTTMPRRKAIIKVKYAVVLTALSIVNAGLALGDSMQPASFGGTVTATEGSFLASPPSPQRNSYPGSVGFQFRVLQPITVTSLGRYYPSSGSSHTINLWATSNAATPLATAIVTGPATGQSAMIYATITPVTLTPNVTYAIAIDELYGGDLWVDNWKPGPGVLNPIISNVVSAFGPTGQYPSWASNAGYLYDTPAMIFTTFVQGAIGPTTVMTATNDTSPLVTFMRASPGGVPSVWPVGSYIGPNGDFNTNAWITLAGDAAITVPYSSIGAMLQIYPDVPAGIIFETSSTSPASYAYGVLDVSGHFRFSQQNDGSHCWGNGANANQSLNDVCLTRTAAGALEVNTGTAGTYKNTKFTAGGNVLDTNGVTLAAAPQPTCSTLLAGKLWYSGHSSGVKDQLAICAADNLNTFVWRPLY
jgi:hypothetical protein